MLTKKGWGTVAVNLGEFSVEQLPKKPGPPAFIVLNDKGQRLGKFLLIGLPGRWNPVVVEGDPSALNNLASGFARDANSSKVRVDWP